MICIDINIDGLELFRSSYDSFWPILGCLRGKTNPFIIAIFCGNKKPPLEQFLEKFVEEVYYLSENGFQFNNKLYAFTIGNYILDAPARCYVKCIVGHTSKYSCEKCTIVGYHYNRRQIFPPHTGEKRTDLSFVNRIHVEHHLEGVMSPFLMCGTKMISQFRLDPMHLVYIGTWKRWLSYLLGYMGPRNAKLSLTEKNEISLIINNIASHIPCEFNRRPRNLNYFKKYKATEFRRLLLYDGLVVFKSIDDNLYKNYLLLQASIFILSHSQFVKLNEMLHMADIMLQEFVQHASKALGKDFLVYNVHCMLHLVEECRQEGTLDSFSAFKYESCLGIIKKYLRSTFRPLEQLFNRDHETKGFLYKTDCIENKITLEKKYKRAENDIIYFVLRTSTFMLNGRSKADRCFATHKGEIVLFNYLVHNNDKVILYGYKFKALSSYYNFPIESMKLGICKVSSLSKNERNWNFENISHKCVLLPLSEEEFLCIPFLHCY